MSGSSAAVTIADGGWGERRYGHARVDAGARKLWVDDLEVSLGSRAFDVLLALIDAGGVATKEALLARAWPGRVVEEVNLPVQINTLRRALGNGAIVTVAGIGYKWALAPSIEAAAPEVPAHNLPAQLTSFVGRQAEQAGLLSLLEVERFVTLVGPGGSGKSRLAVQLGFAVAAEERFRDGVCFTELASLTDPGLVAEALATSLGVARTNNDVPADAALLAHLKTRRALLIVDNCEHVLSSVAVLAEQILRLSPAIRILATSREALRVPGEISYLVPPLDAPGADADLDIEALLRFDSVELFQERAAGASAFVLSAANAAAVAEICRRLDGIPLAIELAATRTRALSVDAIAARLDDRFRLLNSGARTHLPRQQTLHALIDWSYEPLDAAQRLLLQRLAVFPGSFTLEAIEAVGVAPVPNADGLDAATLIDVLSQLVEKSLVTVEASGERYRLLETIRVYALDRLREMGASEAIEARGRHLLYYLAFATKSMKNANGPAQSKLLSLLDAERENLLAAHAWAEHESISGPVSLALTQHTVAYLGRRDLIALSRRLSEEALARPKAMDRTPERAHVLFWLGWIHGISGNFADACTRLRECLSIAREIKDAHRLTAALQPLASALLGLRDYAAAREIAQEALDLARARTDRAHIRSSLIVMAQVARAQGEQEAAATCLSEALDLARESGNPDAMSVAMLNLAMMQIDAGDLAAAAVHITDTLDGTMLGAREHMVLNLFDVMTGFAAACGAWERAAFFFGAAQKLLAATGYVRDPADGAFVDRWIAHCRASAPPHVLAIEEERGAALSTPTMVHAVRAWLGSRAPLPHSAPLAPPVART